MPILVICGMVLLTAFSGVVVNTTEQPKAKEEVSTKTVTIYRPNVLNFTMTKHEITITERKVPEKLR